VLDAVVDRQVDTGWDADREGIPFSRGRRRVREDFEGRLSSLCTRAPSFTGSGSTRITCVRMLHMFPAMSHTRSRKSYTKYNRSRGR